MVIEISAGSAETEANAETVRPWIRLARLDCHDRDAGGKVA